MTYQHSWLPCLILLAVPSLLLAQADRQREQVQVKGALKAVAPGAMQVEGKDGGQWVIKVDPRSRYNVFQGSADPRFLRPGMFVEFRSSFDRKGKPQSEVRELKIFTPTKDSRLGLTPVAGNLAAKGLFSSDDDDDPRKKPAQPEVLPYNVAGRIRAVKDDKLVVLAGPMAVSAQLSDKVQIAFSLADFSLVRPGDTVEASGWAYPQQPNLVMASRVTITAAKPLGIPEEKPKPGQVPDLNSLDDF